MPTTVLTTREAAEYLKCSVETLKRRAAAGEIPAAKTGREWRFLLDELEAWLRAGGDRYEETVDAGMAEIMRERIAAGPERLHSLEDTARELGL